MNIAFVTPEYVTESRFDGGLSNYLYKISIALRSKGHNIFIVVSSENDEMFVRDHITVCRVKMKSKILNLFLKIFRGRLYEPMIWIVHSWKLNRRLEELHKTNNIDIVQYASYTATALFRPKYIPAVARISSYLPAWDKASELLINRSKKLMYYLENRSLKNVDCIYGPSAIISEIVKQKINRNISVIESPLLLKSDQDDKLFYDIVKGKKYLLFFGSIAPLKGVVEIGDIIGKLLAKYPSLYFVFAGKDQGYRGKPMMDYVWENAGRNRGRCVYLGRLSQALLYPIIENAYAVVLPSRIDNFPNTCTESMAMGKIVIGTSGASFEQLIRDGHNGFLCERSNQSSLYQALEAILSLSKKRKEVIETAAKRCVERLEPDLIADEVEKLYLETMEKVCAV